MKLTAKLVGLFMLVAVGLTGVYGYLAVERGVRQFSEDSRADAHRIGTAMEALIVMAWREKGEQGALELIQKTTRSEQRTRIRWVWFDAPRGDPYRPEVPSDRLTRVFIEQHETLLISNPDGPDTQHTYWPIPVDGSRRGGLELTKSLSHLDAYRRDTFRDTLLLMVAMVALTGLVATLAGIRWVGRPLEALIAKTRRIATGDLTGPVALRTHDELSELADSINQMCESLATTQEQVRTETEAHGEALEQLRHAERLGVVGRLASGMAHELGTPLNVVGGRAGLIASGRLSESEVTESAKTIQAEAERMTAILRQLLDFARRKTPQKSLIDLRQVARQTLALLEPMAVKRNIRLQLLGDEVPVMAFVDAGQIQQVLTNLLVNAGQAMPDGGPIDVELFANVTLARTADGRDGPPRTWVGFRVRDRGEGISEENLQHLFEPFFTTKDVGEGTGLGLSVSYGIVQEHGGWIDVTSEPGHGSCFTVTLPAEVDPCPTES